MFNATITKFGHPQTVVRIYEHWVVLLRPQQVTAGSLILAAKSEVTAYGMLPQEAFIEQGLIVADIEASLASLIAYERINYLMLMMVDPHVHFHVIPRYPGSRKMGGIDLVDHGWPGPPDLKSGGALDDAGIARGVEALHSAWPEARTKTG